MQLQCEWEPVVGAQGYFVEIFQSLNCTGTRVYSSLSLDPTIDYIANPFLPDMGFFDQTKQYSYHVIALQHAMGCDSMPSYPCILWGGHTVFDCSDDPAPLADLV